MIETEITRSQLVQELLELKLRVSALTKIEDKFRLFRSLINRSNDAIFVVDPQTSSFLDVNDTACRQLGYTREEMLSRGAKDIKSSKRMTLSWEEHIRALKEKGSLLLEDVIEGKDGRRFPVEINASYIVQDDAEYLISVMRDITERKQAQENLQAEYALRKAIEASMVAGVAVVDLKGRQTYVNQAFCKMVGWSEQELLGASPPFVYWPPEDIQAIYEGMKKNISGERPSAAVELRFCRRNGERFYVLAVHSALVDGMGKVTGWLAVFYDITERKRAEEALRESEYALKRSQATAHVGHWAWDTRTNKVAWSEEMHRIFGIDRECFMGDLDNVVNVAVHPDDKERVVRSYKGVLSGQKPETIEYRVIWPDGSIHSLWTQIDEQVCDDAGNIIRLSGVVQDITERKQSEDAVRKTNAWLQTLIQAIPDMVFFKDTEGRHLIVNRMVEDSMGLSRDEIVGKTAAELMPPGPAEACRKSDEEVMKRRTPVRHEEQFPGKDGMTVYLDMLKAPLFDSRNNVIGLVAIGRDITERKKAEEELHRSREFIKNILDTVDEGFIVIDRDYRIISANNAYSKQTHLCVEDIIGKHCYEISHRRQRPCYEAGEECAVRRSYETGEPHTSVHKHEDRDGNIIYVETKSYPLRDASGMITSAIEVINNITEKQLLEEQLLRNQKLEAVGLLAGGIAHDFNNLLQGVFGSISLARQFSDKDSTVHQLLNDAERALQLSRNLTRQLLTFSKGGEPVKSVVSLENIILDSVKFALSGSNVDFRFCIDNDLWPVEADAGQISQVIQNIVLNASDAMRQCGTVSIGAHNVIHDRESFSPLEKGKYVKITIEDSGTGISADHLSRIFDPYFTTKQKGNGLGLATSYSIIKKHKGLIDVQSELGAGSTFTIFLPAAAEMPLPDNEPVKGLVRGKGRILFMDDEAVVRSVAEHMLQALGYEADFAENGEQAVAKYVHALNTHRSFDAVILDLTIRGGMSGTETLMMIRETDPEVRAIVSSGYSDDPLSSRYEEYGFKAVLTKPYEIDVLSQILHSVMNIEKS